MSSRVLSQNSSESATEELRVCAAMSLSFFAVTTERVAHSVYLWLQVPPYVSIPAKMMYSHLIAYPSASTLWYHYISLTFNRKLCSQLHANWFSFRPYECL